MFRAQLAILVCVAAHAHGDTELNSANATNNTAPSLSNYITCDSDYYDLRYSSYEAFFASQNATRRSSHLLNERKVQCQGSSVCLEYAAQIFYVRCRNTNLGSSNIMWDCNPTFRGTGYSIARSNINCESFPKYSTCVLRDSCIFLYTPKTGSKTFPVNIFVGFGGFFALCLLGLAIFLCVQRRNRSMTSRGTTTTTVFSNAPPPTISAQTCTAGASTYPSAPGYPGPQGYPPPYTAPYPQYAPQYIPPQPPKHAPY